MQSCCATLDGPTGKRLAPGLPNVRLNAPASIYVDVKSNPYTPRDLARCRESFTSDLGEDVLGCLGPDERMFAAVPALDKGFDLDRQGADGGEHATADDVLLF